MIEKAEGNALFVEEILSFLSERGVLRNIAGKVDFDANAVAATLPASVQSLLTARVDRLAPRDRTLLQAAAVICRQFDPELLAAVAENGENAETRLQEMKALDLVYPHDKSGTYVSKHALSRDALYQSLLTGPRVALHLKIAAEIERRAANRLAEVAETLAHHYAQTDRADKTFTYLAMSERAIKVASKTDDPHVQYSIRYVIAFAEMHCGRTDRARASAKELIEVRIRLADPRATGLGLSVLALVALPFDDYTEALEYAEQAIAVAITPS